MNDKMIKTANGLHKFLEILKKVLVAAGCVVVVMAVLLPIFKDKMISSTTNVSFGPLELVLANPIINHPSNEILMIEAMLIGALAMLAVSWFVLKTLCDILAPMKDGRPFENGVSRKIRNLGILTLIFGTLSQIAEMIVTGAAFAAYDVETLWNTTLVKSCNFDFHFDVKYILGALLIFLLSYVFKYGEELQRESDETL